MRAGIVVTGVTLLCLLSLFFGAENSSWWEYG